MKHHADIVTENACSKGRSCLSSVEGIYESNSSDCTHCVRAIVVLSFDCITYCVAKDVRCRIPALSDKSVSEIILLLLIN